MLPEQSDGGKGRACPYGHPHLEVFDAYIDCWDPKLGAENERIMPTEDLMEVRIGPSTHQVIKVCISLIKEEKHNLVGQFIKTVKLFSRTPYDMSGIDTRVVYHLLVVNCFSKSVAQTKRKVGKEKIVAIDEEVKQFI